MNRRINDELPLSRTRCNVAVSNPPRSVLHDREVSQVTNRVLGVVGVSLLLALLFPRDAFAYLDPGSGSLIFQTVVAALAGVAYGVRVYWHKLRGLFGGKSVDPQADRPVDPPSTH